MRERERSNISAGVSEGSKGDLTAEREGEANNSRSGKKDCGDSSETVSLVAEVNQFSMSKASSQRLYRIFRRSISSNFHAKCNMDKLTGPERRGAQHSRKLVYVPV